MSGYVIDALQDYLLYGRYYIPTARLDAVYSTRISRTLQAVVAAISDPSLAPARSSDAGPSMGMSNLMLSLQHDTGRWCTEYSWSADDGMWGARVLHNFGRLAGEEDLRERRGREKRVDEEEAMEGGLKGRFSAGAEVYFSAKEKSGGGALEKVSFVLLEPDSMLQFRPVFGLRHSPTRPLPLPN
jgi:distribution and morphology protein 10